MTDTAVSQALAVVADLEREVRHEIVCCRTAEERTQAIVVARQATALRKPMERWLAARAIAHAQESAPTSS